jgi:LysM repeat protein
MKRAPSIPVRRRTAPTGVAASLLALAAWVGTAPVGAQSLKGSPTSLDRQNRVAQQQGYTFITTGSGVKNFAEKGWLVPLRPNQDFEFNGVSYPYTRPEVAVFVRRLSAQYRAACGERLVVTSLTRPTSRQPRNASARSVHPTGMALDIRYSRSRTCREWIEGVLLDLEGAAVLEATRERYPAHYHVAVYPRQYTAYVDALNTRQASRVTETAPLEEAPSAYQVRAGDSLWTIARRHGTTVDELRNLNRLRSSQIYAGQVLEVPRAR